jgi:hypothetical protein
VVSLIGMWIGGLVVSKVHGTLGTWCCLLPLLALHLWANWKAVKSVRLTSLNTDRASILFGALLHGQVKNLNEVGEEESILGLTKVFLLQTDVCRVGVSVSDFLHALPGEVGDESRKYKDFTQLFDIFKEEQYLLWCDNQTKRGIVLLKESATGETQAKAICHFLRTFMLMTRPAEFTKPLLYQHRYENDHGIVRSGSDVEFDKSEEDVDTRHQSLRDANGGEQSFHLISETLLQNQAEWQGLRDQVESAGWDLNLTNLAGGRCNRVRTNEMTLQEKKDR